ncbi:MAG: hypothetical protein ACM3VW_04250, partial [Bacteroidota bacterium]
GADGAVTSSLEARVHFTLRFLNPYHILCGRRSSGIDGDDRYWYEFHILNNPSCRSGLAAGYLRGGALGATNLDSWPSFHFGNQAVETMERQLGENAPAGVQITPS